MTLKRYNLYTTQHQKLLHVMEKILLTLLMNIILCDIRILNIIFYPFKARTLASFKACYTGRGVKTKLKILF